jgi:hypothetical protein
MDEKKTKDALESELFIEERPSAYAAAFADDAEETVTGRINAWSNQGSTRSDMILTEDGRYVAPQEQYSNVEMVQAVRSYGAHAKNPNVPLVTLADTVITTELAPETDTKCAVLYHGSTKVLIPNNKIGLRTQHSLYAAEMSMALAVRKRNDAELPDTSSSEFLTEVRNRMLNSIVGNEITYCVRYYDEKNDIAIGSRTDAMRYMAQQMSQRKSVDGLYQVREGTRIRAKVLATYKTNLVACFSGIEMEITRKQLIAEYTRSLREVREFVPGSTLDLVITACKRDEARNIIDMSVRSLKLQSTDELLRRVELRHRYNGTIIRVNRSGIIVRILNNTVNVNCSLIYNSRIDPKPGMPAIVEISVIDKTKGVCKGIISRVGYAPQH